MNLFQLQKTRVFFVALVAIPLLAAAGCRGTEGARFEREGYVLEAALKPDPPVVGDNSVEFKLLDPQGDPVEGAEVSVRAFMPAMGAMPAMEAKGKGEEKRAGRYEASFNLSMSGNWDLTIQAQKEGRELVSFSLLIAPPRPGLIDPNAGMASQGGHQHGAAAPSGGDGEAMLSIPDPRQQLIGVRTALVEKRDLSRPIRTVGRVEADETKRWHVTLKFSGWIDRLFVDFTGAFVEKGQPLFSIYSQELYVSQQEYLDALEAFKKGQAPRSLVDAARERLTLWDLTDTQIEDLGARGKTSKSLTIYSPARGYVVEKMAVEGHEVKPGMRLYEIADLSSIWVIADVYEYEASLVKAGSKAWMSEPYAPGPPRKGVVDYIYPSMDVRSRTLPVRLVFSNPSLSLKPGMFVNVKIESPLGVRVAVPEEAVLFSGEHRYVFVDLGGGHFEPREIFISDKSDDAYAVVEGLEGGERVVTSANFLISSEAQLKGALPKWKGAEPLTPKNPVEETGDSLPPMAPMPGMPHEHDVRSPPVEQESGEEEPATAPEMGGGHEHHMHGGHDQ